MESLLRAWYVEPHRHAVGVKLTESNVQLNIGLPKMPVPENDVEERFAISKFLGNGMLNANAYAPIVSVMTSKSAAEIAGAADRTRPSGVSLSSQSKLTKAVVYARREVVV